MGLGSFIKSLTGGKSSKGGSVKVKSHMRGGKKVRSYTRGKGMTKSARAGRVTKSDRKLVGAYNRSTSNNNHISALGSLGRLLGDRKVDNLVAKIRKYDKAHRAKGNSSEAKYVSNASRRLGKIIDTRLKNHYGDNALKKLGI